MGSKARDQLRRVKVLEAKVKTEKARLTDPKCAPTQPTEIRDDTEEEYIRASQSILVRCDEDIAFVVKERKRIAKLNKDYDTAENKLSGLEAAFDHLLGD